MNLFRAIYLKENHHASDQDVPETGIRLLLSVIKREWWELIKLNVLFWAACLPVVTIPCAMTAMSRLTVTMVRDQNHYLWRDFWDSFRGEWKRSYAAGGLWILMQLLLAFGCWFYRTQGITPLYLLCGALFILVLLSGFYLFPMIACTDLHTPQMLKNAVLLLLVCFPQTLLVVLAIGVLIAAYVMLYPVSAPLLPAILFSLCGLLISWNTWTALEKYVLKSDQ